MALARVLCEDLVGRETEISILEDALLATLRGDGGVVIVGGEAGMGKTRLVADLVTRARRRGCVVVSGVCSEAELSLLYLPFLEAIGNHLAKEDVGALRERLGSAVYDLAQLFPQIGRPQPPARMLSRPSCACSNRSSCCCAMRPGPAPSSSSSRTCTGPTRQHVNCSTTRPGAC